MIILCCLYRRRAVAQHKPKMVFLTSPNNPDGSMMSDEEVGDGSGAASYIDIFIMPASVVNSQHKVVRKALVFPSAHLKM